MNDFQSVLSAANELPVSDRLRLIDALSSTVPDDQPPSLSQEWIDEINRRSNEIDHREVSAISWEIVRENLRRQVGLDD